MKKRKYTNKFVIDIARKCETFYQFRKEFPSFYLIARRRKILKEIKKFLPSEKIFYSEKDIKRILKKIKSLRELRENHTGVISWLKAKGVYHKWTSHFKRTYAPYSLKDALKILKKYNTLEDFRKEEDRVYRWLIKHGYKKLYFKHLEKTKRIARVKGYPDQEIKKLVKKSKNLKFFRENFSPVYTWIVRNGKLGMLKSLKRERGNLPQAPYVLEFKDIKTAYIGITEEFQKRLKEHRSNFYDNKMKDFLKKGNYEFIKWELWQNNYQSRKIEGQLIERYKKSGWKVLNRGNPFSIPNQIREGKLPW